MKSYSIRELERLSEVKAHTIRAWELRYGVLKPTRKNNIRIYSISDLKKLTRISYLHRKGYKLGYLARLDETVLSEKVVSTLVTLEDRQEYLVNDLIFAMQEKDPLTFDTILDQASSNWPVEGLMEGLIFPFLLRTDLLWNGRLLTEEHFVVTTIRKKIMMAIETTRPVAERGQGILLFLLTGRQLDLGLLYANYIFKKSGWRVTNIGTGITVDNLREYCDITTPDILFTYSSFATVGEAKTICSLLGESLPGAKIITASYPDIRKVDYTHENLVSMQYVTALSHFSQVVTLN